MQSVEINIFTDWIFKKIKTQLPISNWATELIIIMRHHPIPSSLLSLHHTWIFHPAFSDLPSIFDDIWEGQKLSLCFWAISRLSSTAEPSFSVPESEWKKNIFASLSKFSPISSYITMVQDLFKFISASQRANLMSIRKDLVQH